MEMNTMSSMKMRTDRGEERRYSVPHGPHAPLPPAASEDLHAWSIYRQNLNSDFTDSALGSSDKSPLPYGNFQLRDTTVQSILNHPRYGPKSPLGSNMYTYLKFGLPRVFPPNGGGGSQRSHHRNGHAGGGGGGGGGSRGGTPGRNTANGGGQMNRAYRDSAVATGAVGGHHGHHHAGLGAGSSGYDSSDNETTRGGGGGGGGNGGGHMNTNGRRVPSNLRKFRSESDFRAMNGTVIVDDHAGGRNGNGNVGGAGGGGGRGAHARAASQMQTHGAGAGHYGNGGGGGNNVPLAALRMANSRASIAGTHHINQVLPVNGKHYGMRSHSEADLLGNEVYDYDMRNTLSRNQHHHQQQQQQQQQQHHNTLLHHHHHQHQQQHQQNQSYQQQPPNSNASMSRRQSLIGSLVYPNIQVHALDALPTLRGVSISARAGELFAVMATSQREGTVLMETLAGLRDRIAGDILVNGQPVTRRGLRSVCSFVPAPERGSLDGRMSVQSTLSFHAALCGPSNSEDLGERIDMLVEDLGLTAVRTTNVSRLTHSERQRLSVACQLLTQASILILDQATTNMDIFDTFFLVEYLRQWCNGGRIVVMTLQPPTFEILSMCSGVLLLSGGRTVFSGSRSDLPRHMGSLGYPCPPFKNPADYYLDLVTLDDLSAAAMLESSARIESLANAWDQLNAAEPPIAAPPATLPTFTRRAGLCGQLGALSKRFVVYKQPDALLAWISKLIAAAVLSLCVGCVFWDVPTTDPQLVYNDRLGYHHCMMVVAFWPLVLLTIRDIHEDRMYAERDMKLGLYGRVVYIFVQCLFNLLPSLCIWLAYLLPAHSMAGLYAYSAGSDTGIYLYMAYMLLYLTAIQAIAQLASHLCNTRTAAALLTGCLVLGTSLAGGYAVHLGQLPAHWQWAQLVSLQRWLLPLLTADEYSAETLANTAGQQLCRNKQVQHQEIIVQHPCPTPNGTAILADLQLLPQDHVLQLGGAADDIEASVVIALCATCVTAFVLTVFAFVSNVRRLYGKRKER